MKLFSFLFTALLSVNAFATVTITSVEHASSYRNDGIMPEIMAGISGRSACTFESTGTVNSCDFRTARAACNYKTVCSSTVLKLGMRAETTGRMILIDSLFQIVQDFGIYTAGTPLILEIPWSKLCQSMGGDSTCNYPGSKILRLGIMDANGNIGEAKKIKFTVTGIENTAGSESLADLEGVKDYVLAPGNSKAVVTDFTTVSDFTLPYFSEVVGVRGFYVKGNCSQSENISTSSPSVFLPVNAEKNMITNNVISGLHNGQTYVFMFGFEDNAGNIGLFKDLSNGKCVEGQHSVTPKAL